MHSKRLASYLAATGRTLLFAGLFCLVMLLWWRIGAVLLASGAAAIALAVWLDDAITILPNPTPSE